MGTGTVLVCDDEELVRDAMVAELRESGYRTIEAADGVDALRMVDEGSPSAVVLDLTMPRMGGLAVLERMRREGHDLPVVIVTANAAVDTAIAATRLGAAGYLRKPFAPRQLTRAVDDALTLRSARRAVRHPHAQPGAHGDFLGESPALDRLFDDMVRLEAVVAPTVLVLGPSGTGKDVVARTIHARGPRRDQMFVEIDCASLPETLVESELFGHERGAFTDAKTSKIGMLEAAGRGVVFLDEIGELTLGTQAKLLRALENRTFKRVGGLATVKLEAQVIAATNRDLKQEVARGRFREDLFYRLDVVTLRIPPLRDRRDDIPVLVAHFLDRFGRTFGRTVRSVAEDAMAALQRYDWPGNVRELKNLLERLVILGTSDSIELSALPAEIVDPAPPKPPRPDGTGDFILPEGGIDLDELERRMVTQAIVRTAGNQTAAAKLLRLSRYQLRYRLEKFQLLPPQDE